MNTENFQQKYSTSWALRRYLELRGALCAPFVAVRKMTGDVPRDVLTILMLRHDRIGDMVLSTAVFKLVRELYPAARIIVIASRTNKDVILHDKAVDDILVYEGIMWFWKICRKRKIDLAIDLFHTHELKQAMLTFLSGARYRMGFECAGREIFFNVKGVTVYPRQHMLTKLTQLAAGGRGGVRTVNPQLARTAEEYAWAAEYISGRGVTIGIHPGGYYQSQRLPAMHFVAAARALLDKQTVSIILFGSPADEACLKIMQGCIGSARVEVFCRRSLRQCMALIGACNIVMCNNSGALHIAAAFGIPTVSTLGPSDDVLWRPWGANHIVLRKDCSCRPCSRAVCIRHTCLSGISVEEIVQSVEKLLQKAVCDRRHGDSVFQR